MDAPHADRQERFSGTPEAFLARCEKLAAADRRAEVATKFFMTLGLISLLTTFVLFVGLAMGSERHLLWVFAPLLLGLLFLGIGRMASTGDLEDRKLEVARFLVETLRPELKRSRPVEAEVDFRAHQKTDPVARDDRGGTVAARYRHPWLKLSVTLSDGTRARIRVESDAKRKERRKRKYTKVKERCVERLTVTLTPPRDRSFGAFTLPGPIGAPGDVISQGGRVEPRRAVFTWRSSVLHRLRDRSGYTVTGDLLSGPEVLGALVASARAARVARAA